MSDACDHNQRTRFTAGFYCEDCKTFFAACTAEYRSSELLFSIRLTLHNLNVERHRNGLTPLPDISAMAEKLKHASDDYESLVAEAEAVMQRYGVNSDSSMVVIQ